MGWNNWVFTLNHLVFQIPPHNQPMALWWNSLRDSQTGLGTGKLCNRHCCRPRYMIGSHPGTQRSCSGCQEESQSGAWLAHNLRRKRKQDAKIRTLRLQNLLRFIDTYQKYHKLTFTLLHIAGYYCNGCSDAGVATKLRRGVVASSIPGFSTIITYFCTVGPWGPDVPHSVN